MISRVLTCLLPNEALKNFTMVNKRTHSNTTPVLVQRLTQMHDPEMLGYLGMLNALQFLDVHNYSVCSPQVFTNAAQEGHLKLVEWLFEKGCMVTHECWNTRHINIRSFLYQKAIPC